MKIIQIVVQEDGIVGLGDDGKLYDRFFQRPFMTGLPGAYYWSEQSETEMMSDTVLAEFTINSLLNQSVTKASELIKKNSGQFEVRKYADDRVEARWKQHGVTAFFVFCADPKGLHGEAHIDIAGIRHSYAARDEQIFAESPIEP